MIDEAVVLAGGFGTRLQSLVSDVPKPMAPIAGRPFLEYLLRYLRHYGIARVVLSVGYKAEHIRGHFGDRFDGIEIGYAQEPQPLGTGGAVRLAITQCQGEQLLVLNGDSFFDVDVTKMAGMHNDEQADASLALRRVSETSRFGRIELADSDSTRIIVFREKAPHSEGQGLINGGVYLLNRATFLQNTGTGAFSIEHDYFASHVGRLAFRGFISEGFFIDIGVPKDYLRAQDEFSTFAY
jgi:D-glycero-alpha-D-manno-heptose 1-phosphate guanylyltransferase